MGCTPLSKNMSGNDMYSTKVAFPILWCGQRDGLFCLRCGFAWRLLASKQGILAPLFMDNVRFGQLSLVCGLVFNLTRRCRCAPLSRMEVHCGFVGAVWCADTLEDVDLLSQLFVTQQGGHGEGCPPSSVPRSVMLELPRLLLGRTACRGVLMAFTRPAISVARLRLRAAQLMVLSYTLT